MDAVVSCMAVDSLTVFPLLELPKSKVNGPPCILLCSLFFGLSLELNNLLNMLICATSNKIFAGQCLRLPK
jgi:hypothetical protein